MHLNVNGYSDNNRYNLLIIDSAMRVYWYRQYAALYIHHACFWQWNAKIDTTIPTSDLKDIKIMEQGDTNLTGIVYSWLL